MTDDVERTVLSDGTIRLTTAGHAVFLQRLRPGVLLLATQGTEASRTRGALMRELESEIAASGPIALFADMRGSTRVDAAGRDEWAAFGKKHRTDLRRVVMLMQSRLVEMAISVLGLFVGGGLVKTVSDERAFAEAIAQDVPGFNRLPSYARTASRG